MHHKAIGNPQFCETRRQYTWERDMHKRGVWTLDKIAITPDGWLIYSLEMRNAGGYWEGEFRLTLCEGDRFAADYPLTVDEFWDFPGMPPGWDIPF